VAFSVTRLAADFRRQRPSGIDLDRPPTPIRTRRPIGRPCHLTASSPCLRGVGARRMHTACVPEAKVPATAENPQKADLTLRRSPAPAVGGASPSAWPCACLPGSSCSL
jgi:hypothetical protein